MLTRTDKSIKNVKYAIVGQFFCIIVNLISRFVFVKTLSIEFLGLSGLFTNILTIFSLTELGVGTAMSYQLYKPLADNDTKKIKVLMELYKKIYLVISAVILILGVLCIPLYPYLINEVPNIENLNLIYSLFVLNTAVSYWFSYKRILVNADQKQYVTTYYKYLFYFILNVFQICVLLLFKNYLLFLVTQISTTFLENIFLSIKVNKLYPFLRGKTTQTVSKDFFKDMMVNVKYVFFHKFGGVVLNSTDNIVISKVLGLGFVAIYSNYMLIINALNAVISQLFNSIIASIGNLNVTSGKKAMTRVFDRLFFLSFWLHIVCSICLICLFNPFIELWLGSSYVVSIYVVFALAFNFYLFGMRKPAMAFREATGNYYSDRFSPIIEAVLNIFFSIILSKYIGLTGVVIGTIISCVCTNLWWEPLVICRKSLNKTIFEYFSVYLKYTFCGIVIAFLTISLTNLLPNSNIMMFIVKAGLSFVLPNLLLIFLFYKNEYFKFYKNLIFDKFLKKIINIKK